VVFNTALAGYQEVLTDPSYAGQIVTMTYPHIGNYGVNREDVESVRPQVAGFVVREASTVASSWRSAGTLAEYLDEAGIVGISEIDTRALTRHLRERGAMRVGISTTESDAAALLERVRGSAEMAGAELASGKTVEAVATAASRAKEPLRDFLLKHADGRDRATFHGLALRMRTAEERAGITDGDLMVLVPAFVTSELRRAFEIGFLLFLPFLVLDLVVSNLLLALGMHMLSPATVSLPFKLLLFVLADGWHLVARGLVESYL